MYLLEQEGGLFDDINGKKVYEKDIIEITLIDKTKKIMIVGELNYQRGFYIHNIKDDTDNFILGYNQTKLIGNIYENKELLRRNKWSGEN